MTSARLVRDEPAWIYLAQPWALATRRLRVFVVETGALVAVVTETPDDTGASITNAAEAVVVQLRAEHPGPLRVVEHYTRTPADPAPDPGHEDELWVLDAVDESGGWRITLPETGAGPAAGSTTEILIGPDGAATWQPVDLAELGIDLG